MTHKLRNTFAKMGRVQYDTTLQLNQIIREITIATTKATEGEAGNAQLEELSACLVKALQCGLNSNRKVIDVIKTGADSHDVGARALAAA